MALAGILETSKAESFLLPQCDSKKSVEMLVYEQAKNIRNSNLSVNFRIIFQYLSGKLHLYPISKTSKVISILIDNFKEHAEIESLLDFCEAPKSSQLILGGPGSGKSSLIAQVLKLRSTQNQTIPVIEYFITRGTIYDSPIQFLRYCCTQIDLIFDTQSSNLGKELGDLYEDLQQRMLWLEENKRTILIIDGLMKDKSNISLLPLLPQPSKSLHLICTSRPHYDVMQWTNFFNWRRFIWQS